MTGFEVAQLTTNILQIIATCLIAFVVKIQASKLKKAELHGDVISAYNFLNSAAVSDVENLRVLDGLGRNSKIDTDETRRKRWCAFLWLVALQQVFLSRQEHLIDDEYAAQSLKQQLAIILKDDLVYWLVANRGFHPKFVLYCYKIRREVAPNKPTEFSEEEAIRGLGELSSS